MHPATGAYEAGMDELIASVERDLLPQAAIESLDPHEPIVVRRVPEPWELVGCGNYAAVFVHPRWPEWVVKVYAPGRPGLADEVQVYERLGVHPAYSRCAHAGPGYLVLARLRGRTLFEHLHRGLPIAATVVEDVDRALDYARERGLFPHDVHAKNVMVATDGRGLVVDVSDFGHPVPCARWDHLEWAYRWIYRPLLLRWTVPLPLWLLDGVRRLYRRIRRWLSRD
jgi:hypothetical protein